jgi:hypothetical protein
LPCFQKRFYICLNLYVKLKVEIVELANFDKVTLYSVERINDDGTVQLNEFEKFSEKMKTRDLRDARQFQEIEGLITEISQSEGAHEGMFRREGIFSAIPAHADNNRFWDSDGETHFGLRLYCVRVTDEILILLNGCSKNTQSPIDVESNCIDEFHFAKKFSEAFFDGLNVNNKITYEGRELGYVEDDWELKFEL